MCYSVFLINLEAVAIVVAYVWVFAFPVFYFGRYRDLIVCDITVLLPLPQLRHIRRNVVFLK